MRINHSGPWFFFHRKFYICYLQSSQIPGPPWMPVTGSLVASVGGSVEISGGTVSTGEVSGST